MPWFTLIGIVSFRAMLNHTGVDYYSILLATQSWLNGQPIFSAPYYGF
jgi:hypothetical protein